MLNNNNSPKDLFSLLIEPKTGYPLTLNTEKTALISQKSKKGYPIKNGIPILLEEESFDVDI